LTLLLTDGAPEVVEGADGSDGTTEDGLAHDFVGSAEELETTAGGGVQESELEEVAVGEFHAADVGEFEEAFDVVVGVEAEDVGIAEVVDIEGEIGGFADAAVVFEDGVGGVGEVGRGDGGDRVSTGLGGVSGEFDGFLGGVGSDVGHDGEAT